MWKDIVMLNVLYITDVLEKQNGISTFMMNYFRHFDRETLHIDFMVIDAEKNLIKEIETAGSKIYYMPKLGLQNLIEVKQYFKNFFQINEKKYSVVHSHFCQMDGIIFPIAKKNGVNLCMSHSHNSKISNYKLRAVRNRLMCVPIKYVSDVWAACSETAGVCLYGKKFLSSTKSKIIRNAVDKKRFGFNPEIRRSLRKELNISDTIVLGTVGSMRPQKNHLFLIDIFYNLLKVEGKTGRYKLIILGDGELRKHIQDKIEKYQIEHEVILMGVRNDTYRLFQAMDIYVLPSLYEGLPISGVEAQMSGLPCLMSDTITKEIDITGIRYLSIDSVYPWIDAIKKLSNGLNNDFTRFDAISVMEKSGYEISLESKRLQTFYIENGK